MGNACYGISKSAGNGRTTTGIGSSSEERAPVQEERSPVQEERAHVQEERAPVQEERAPVQEERAPVQEERAPEIAATSQQTAVPSFEGIDCSINGDEDEQFDKLRGEDALCLTNNQKFFPELAWRKVMEKLEKKADIGNCFNASPFFGQFLQEKREREVVLPIVFGVLAKLYCDMNNRDESYKETNLESIPWHRPARQRQPHRMTPIWKCRLVCKTWNWAIEEIHRNEDAGHYRMESDLYKAKNYQLSTKRGDARFDMESKVVKFLRNIEATHFDAASQRSKKCPYLGRYVKVDYDDANYVESKQAYFNKLTEMFEKFGEHVWYFKLVFSWFDGQSEDELVYIYLKVKEFAELMPNLKVLRIDYRGFRPHPKVSLQALEEEIQRSPFPKLTKLEMVSAAGQIPGVFCSHLVYQNRQISRLEVRNDLYDTDISAIFVNKLPKLNQLSLSGINPRNVTNALEAYPATLNLKKFIFNWTSNFPYVSWSRVFSTIGSKLNSDLCTDLLLEMPCPLSDEDRMSALKDSLLCRLKLANIRRCLVAADAPFCMDFLLPSKNTLREITLQSCPDKEDTLEKGLRDQQVVKFLGCKKKMEQSNITKEFPRLRKLRVDIFWLEVSLHYTIKGNGLVKLEKEEKLNLFPC